MKKAVLIFGVIVIFVAYTMLLRNQHGRTGGVSTTSALSSNSSSTNAGNTSANSSNTGSSGSTGSATFSYNDGTYTGDSEDAFYGNVQVSATISGGKITTIDFLSFPNDSPNSQDINGQATPLLKQEALKAQSANVNIISGATMTSQAFAKSLQSALQQAKA